MRRKLLQFNNQCKYAIGIALQGSVKFTRIKCKPGLTLSPLRTFTMPCDSAIGIGVAIVASVNSTIKRVAKAHRQADRACGREWECACSHCNTYRAELSKFQNPDMSTKESQVLIGKLGEFPVPIKGSMTIRVRIADVRQNFGRTDVLIQPVGMSLGSGEAWVSLDAVTISQQ